MLANGIWLHLPFHWHATLQTGFSVCASSLIPPRRRETRESETSTSLLHHFIIFSFSVHCSAHYVFWVQLVSGRPIWSRPSTTVWVPAFPEPKPAWPATPRLPESESDRIWTTSSITAQLYWLSYAEPADGLPESAATTATNGIFWSALSFRGTSPTELSKCSSPNALDTSAVPDTSFPTASCSSSPKTTSYRLCGDGGQLQESVVSSSRPRPQSIEVKGGQDTKHTIVIHYGTRSGEV